MLSPFSPSDGPKRFPFTCNKIFMDFETIWARYTPRVGDIAVCSAMRSGTTWTQCIANQLVRGGQEFDEGFRMYFDSPWLELNEIFHERIFKALEENKYRRIIKTHLPMYAMPFYKEVQYLFVGRNGLDVCYSLWRMHSNWTVDTLNRCGFQPCPQFSDFFDGWLNNRGFPYFDWFDHIQSWWDYRFHPQVLFLHYQLMKQRPRETIKDIANFCGIDIPSEECVDNIVKHSSIDFMRQRQKMFGAPKSVMNEDTFINEGKSCGYKGILSEQQIINYHNMCKERFSVECNQWINQGLN